MRRFIGAGIVVLGMAAGMAHPAFADDSGVGTLDAELSGSQEIPVMGPAGAMGTSDVFTVPSAGLVCYTIIVQGLTSPATAAHIHHGAAGVAGPVVITLEAPNDGGVTVGCVDEVDKALVSDIQNNPGDYYVNVHTADFPGGADRGQLEAE